MDIRTSSNYKGYTALLAENTDPANAGDMHEGFEIGYEDKHAADDVEARDDGAMTGKNRWPSEADVSGFRTAVLEY